MARVESEQAARRQAERPIYDAADRLEKSIVMLASLRALIQPRLPIAEAEAEMDDTEDLIDQLQSRLGAALAIHTLEVERLQLAEDARYNAANDDAANREAA
jgi:hypothetical protein